MRRIEKKAWPEYFEKVLDGSKTYELRLNDFEIEPGDILILKEWNPETKEYTGREIEKTVGYVGPETIEGLTRYWSHKEIEEKGIQVISLK